MEEKMLISASMGVLNPLLEKLATLMGEEYTKLKDVRKQAAYLYDELSSMAALLKDLADMEGLDNQTKQWRNKVREMSYDIEDCLDDFTHRVGGPHDSKGFLRRVKTLRARHQIANKIQELKARVQEASEQHVRYKLDSCMSRSGNVVVDLRMTALYADASRLVGIDGPKEEVISLLTKQEGDDWSTQDLRVVSIVGFGGLGKTSLATTVYNKFGESFSCKAFVSVSQKPDIMVLLKSLASQIFGQRVDTDELHNLIKHLKKYMQSKRYLVVVDDLWDPLAWESIKCAFPEGHNGSRVLTTTRIERVAVTCCNYQWEFIYRMKPLDDHNSRQLFHNRVFGLGSTCPEPFEGPSDKILQKCGGMPLAIISIASLLASQSDKSMSQWTCVLNSLRSSSLRSNPSLEGMMQILNLSYTHLPHHLKTCFLYIGMYPEDHEIEKDYLIMQWVAEGFVAALDGRDALEVAGSYFNELVNRSMIIQDVVYQSFTKERIYCKVHDMFLDLIVSKSKEERFLGVVTNLQTIPTKDQARRLSLQNVVIYDKHKLHISLPHVRSLFSFQGYLGNIQRLELIFLRVLFICKLGGSDLTQIGKLFHLRYLYIQSYLFKDRRRHVQTYPKPDIQLPRQIGGLKHLETLMIDEDLSFLPHDIVHLPALSYLKVPRSIVYPVGISNMKSLHILDNFDPTKQSVENLRALGELPNLRELYMHVDKEDGFFRANETHKDALLSSIEKLINCNLRRLTLYAPGYLGYGGWNSLYLSARYIEQLHLQFPFPGLPVWIGQLKTLNSLEIHVDELYEDDIAVLAGLPVLARLVLSVSRLRRIIFGSSTAFKELGYFEPSIEDFTFHAGAMPKVETLRFQLPMHEVKTCGVRIAGIEHLANLKKVAICLVYDVSEESDVSTIVAAVKSFFDDHPGRPITHITTWPIKRNGAASKDCCDCGGRLLIHP